MPRFIHETIFTDNLNAADTVAKSIYPARAGVQIDWPYQVEYKNLIYFWYHKQGSCNKTGLAMACYKLADENTDVRLWLRCDGEITED